MRPKRMRCFRVYAEGRSIGVVRATKKADALALVARMQSSLDGVRREAESTKQIVTVRRMDRL